MTAPAALAGTSMSFTSGEHGRNDFSALREVARKEAVKKSAVCTRVAAIEPPTRQVLLLPLLLNERV